MSRPRTPCTRTHAHTSTYTAFSRRSTIERTHPVIRRQQKVDGLGDFVVLRRHLPALVFVPLLLCRCRSHNQAPEAMKDSNQTMRRRYCSRGTESLSVAMHRYLLQAHDAKQHLFLRFAFVESVRIVVPQTTPKAWPLVCFLFLLPGH